MSTVDTSAPSHAIKDGQASSMIVPVHGSWTRRAGTRGGLTSVPENALFSPCFRFGEDDADMVITDQRMVGW